MQMECNKINVSNDQITNVEFACELHNDNIFSASKTRIYRNLTKRGDFDKLIHIHDVLYSLIRTNCWK